jgi:ATP-dependent Zn protease
MHRIPHAILKQRRDTLEAAATLLLERETLDAGALAPFARLVSESSAVQEKPAAA